MKRVIQGKSYNTETATEIVMIHHPEFSDGWWALYQTRHGAFFEVRVNHDGEEILDFGPLTDEEAMERVQKHAPNFVDQYFGPFPEGGAAERRMTIRVPENLAERIERAAAAKNLSLNSYAMRCLEQGVAADGHPKQPGAM